jgi:hypothetical protein
MSFLNRHTAILIHDGFESQEEVFPGMFLIGDDPQITDEGWDTNTIQLILPNLPGITLEEINSRIPVGTQVEGKKWWVTGWKPKELAPKFYGVEVRLKGWVSVPGEDSKAWKIKFGSAAESQSGTNIRVPEFPGDTVGVVRPKVETHEATPTVSISYPVEDFSTLAPAKALVGRAADPDVPGLVVPPTVWAWLADYVYHWPNGWVLMGLEEDRLVGARAALATLSFKYVRDITPG